MRWRFADLPVRAKFMVTLGIPVLGMVLLIGKQVDSSIKRSAVYGYIKGQSERIGLFSEVMNALQKESAYTVGYLTGRPVTENALRLQYTRTDHALSALRALNQFPALSLDEIRSFDELVVLRHRARDRSMDVNQALRPYRSMNLALLDELGRVGKLALDPGTKDRLYAHLRLLSAKQALSVVRDQISMGLNDSVISPARLAELSDQISQYETNMVLFERDAPAEVMSTYRSVFQGPDVNFMRSITGTVKERRALVQGSIDPDQWWELSLLALDKLKQVEDHSLELIVTATAANNRDARLRLLVVLAALIGVVGAVTVMGVLIMRSLRKTVTEVTNAARSLAVGDVSAEVPVNSSDEIGNMALSFNGMIDNIRSLADSAEAIGKGNYDTTVNVRGPKDALGIALARMKENLKAARIRDDEQTQALLNEKRKLEEANERIYVLIKEMHHRVKNNLQVIASLLRLQSATFTDERLQAAFDQSQNRVTSMALIHEKLYKGDELAMVDVGNYIHELFAELVRLNDVSEQISYGTDIDSGLAFDLTTMVPLGLLINELITNSFKHAFKGRDSGRIMLAIHMAEPKVFDIRYSDNGVGIPWDKMQDDGTTLGISLIESLVEQINGRMTVEGDEQGTRYHIRFQTP